MFKIGIIREGKVPSDARAPLTPQQCAEVLTAIDGIQLVVQPSPVRCFKDEEYVAQGIALQEDLSDCDILLGVKEVPLDWLIADKTYLFFSHTIKKQRYNQRLLQTVLERRIRLIDYETLTDALGDRLIAFGFYAGVVGAHNGVWAYGQRTGLFQLPRMCQSHDYAVVKAAYTATKFAPMRIVVTGSGRVASGALHNLRDMGIREVSPSEFLHKEFKEPIFVQLFAQDYVRHRGRPAIFDKRDFYANGGDYESIFAPYYRRADIFLNCIYYDKAAPAFFTVTEMAQPDFQIQVIADISCDIAPDASVPATIRPSKISDPLYGFDPVTGAECAPHAAHAVDIMAIDNLPSELPRDASAFFGRQMIDNILPELCKPDSEVIARGTIAEKGALTSRFSYLSDYVAG
jgi:saccharopine dehydrogenase (NAD+, L-lysine forming)